MVITRRRFCVAAIGTLVAACDGGASLAPRPVDLPESLLVRPRTVRPQVEGVWIARSDIDDVSVVIRFTEPMDEASVEAALAVASPDDIVRAFPDSGILELDAAPTWDSESREMFLLAKNAGATVVVVIDRTAIAQNGLELDGAVPPGANFDPLSYHRTEDDGFNAPATYISMPYYRNGSDSLPGHPSFLLRESRPGIHCWTDTIGSAPVTQGALGTIRSGTITCGLLDSRSAPDRTDRDGDVVLERIAQRAWKPEFVPTARMFDGEATRVVETHFGKDAGFPSAKLWTVINPVGETGLRISGLGLSGDESTDGLFIAPANDPEPLWPVTGFTAPDIIWTNPVLVDDLAGLGSGQIEVNPGAAWLENEFAGQIYRRLTPTVLEQRIVSNRASNMQLVNDGDCGPCTFEIATDIGERYAAGDRIRIVSPFFQVPVTGVPGGDWTLSLRDGRDLHGLLQTDRIRDGDEINFVPDDTVQFQLQIP